MTISISVADVKRKAMIETGDTSFDSAIAGLISEMQPAIEHAIAPRYLHDTSDAGLQATLRLGMLETITGEFIQQMRRRAGAAEEFSIAGVSMGPSAVDGTELIERGQKRLAPYLRAALPMAAETISASSTLDRDTLFSTGEEVW